MASSNVDDLITELKRVSDEILAAISNSKVTPNQVQLNKLSELSTNLGLVQAGEFRTGNGAKPGFGFSGTRMAYPPVWYNGNWWNVVGIERDSLQFGLRAQDGIALFAGGNAVMDSDGLKFSSLLYGLIHTATNAGNERTGKWGMVLREGSSTPALSMVFEGPAAGSNIVVNGDGETGSVSSWTDAQSAWETNTTSPFNGSYSIHHKPTVTTYPGLLTQVISGIFASSYYTIEFAGRLVTGEFSPFIQLQWMDAGSSILRTDTVFSSNQPSWSNRSQSIKSPAGTTQVKIILSPGDPFGDAYFDDIKLYLSGVFSGIYFTPDLLYVGKSFVVGTVKLPNSANSGFLYIPAMDGAPTGTPDVHDDAIPVVYDSTNNNLYIYNGTWKSAHFA